MYVAEKIIIKNQIDIGRVFTYEEAAKYCGVKSSGHFSECISGKRKHHDKHPLTKERLQWELVK